MGAIRMNLKIMSLKGKLEISEKHVKHEDSHLLFQRSIVISRAAMAYQSFQVLFYLSDLNDILVKAPSQ